MGTWPCRVVSAESDESREYDGGAGPRCSVQRCVTDLLILTYSAVPSSKALPAAEASRAFSAETFFKKKHKWVYLTLTLG